MFSKTVRVLQATMAAVAIALTAAGCSSSGPQAVGNAAGQGQKTITLGYDPYDDVIAPTYLWKSMLEKHGYTVKMQSLDVAPVYSGVASGQLDVFFGAVPLNHADYWKKYSSDFVTVGQWYDSLLQGIVVPNYVDAKSVEDLAGKASDFGGKIVGIEPGSGLMAEAKNSLTTYGLSGYNLVDGSTSTMLAALDRAIKDKQPIAVTLWQPNWTFDKYPIHLLSDPKHVFPPNDTYKVISSKKFSKDQADLASAMSKFHMDQNQLQSLMSAIHDAGQGHEDEAVASWTSKNQAAVDAWSANIK